MANIATTLRFFLAPIIASVICLVIVGVWGGPTAFITAVLLAFLEISLSFDNAVVNARVLEKMDLVWRRRFLTWGFILSVILVRVVLPIGVVAISAWIHPLEVARLALFDAVQYGELLKSIHGIIYAFGATFLTLVGLKYFFDEAKNVHWVGFIEERLSRWGQIEAIEIALVLVLLLITSAADHQNGTAVLFSGIFGVITFIAVNGITSAFTIRSGTQAGIALFIYLNVLDAAFSLDSVVGAFALSTQIIVIMTGLGIGAYFVRALTLYLVEHSVLKELIYIEQGAHWAIIGLAGTMYASIFWEVPEPLTGFLGFSLIMLAYLSSVRRPKLPA